MKKITILSLILCVSVLATVATIPTAKASIGTFNWLNTEVRNYTDAFYGTAVTGYEEGTTATLFVNVINNVGGTIQLNVSAVKVGFDWGINYSSTECSMDNPVAIPSNQPRVFTIQFEVPSTLVASNMITHSYIIYVESVNGTSASDTKVIIPGSTYSPTTGPYGSFVVYSSDQATATDQLRQLNSLKANTGILPIVSSHGRVLQQQSAVEEDLGDASYQTGDFASASTHYTNALNLLQQAWGNETATWASGENGLIGVLQGSANMLNMEGVGIIVVSVGFLLMGVGVIIYLVRKSKQPQTPK